MAKATHQTLLDRIHDAARIGENDDWEFKGARGGFPASLWETYSAMANSAGGTIVLGAVEHNGVARLDGVSSDQLGKLTKAFWDQHNNRQIISRSLSASGDAQLVEVDKGWLLVIRVRQANRQERPVYKGQNPLEGTFKRRHEGDYRCSPEEVRRMFADASDVPADARVLEGFGPGDLDKASLAAYRNRFSASRPNHPWLALDDMSLLEQLGGWRKDRENDHEGLTLAGLLMFGRHQAIIAPGAAPTYMVDYRDYRGRRRPEDRWTDRLYPDGTWEANLFQFFQRAWLRLVADLKVPFRLEDGQRIDDTPVHVALREAFVNSMIHADYTVGGGIVIERYEDRYRLSNPGTLLVSEAQLRQGGVSECRNRSLQRMFLMIGGGEQAGSGYARIQEGWRSQHWRAPRLMAQTQPDRVRLDMPMLSLMPEWAFEDLRRSLRNRFDALSEHERVVLATALIEDEVTNVRMQDLIAMPSAEITKLLRGLVTKGLLEADNQRRWTRYRLPASISPRSDLFNIGSSPRNGEDSPRNGGDSPRSEPVSPHIDGAPVPSLPTPEEFEALRPLAEPVSKQSRASAAKLRAVITDLCRGRFLTAEQIADLCHRTVEKLRERTLTKMVKEGQLRHRYPDQPNRPDQAYATVETKSNAEA
jgi:ATP-dependent DNA helicase RecG